MTNTSSAPLPDGADLTFPQANIVAVNAIAGALATTLGPTPNDKLVVNQIETGEASNPTSSTIDDVVVSHDGATILDGLPLEHPIAPVVRRIVGPERPGTTAVEGEDIPDGVTTTVVLTANLLDRAEALLDQGVHPTDILRGYHRALDVTTRTMDELTTVIEDTPDRKETELSVARTAMTGNDAGGRPEEMARMAVEAVDLIGSPTEETLAVRTFETGSIADSRLVRGAVLDRNTIAHDRMPTRVENASVLVIGGYRRGKASDGRSGGLLDPVVQEDGERIRIESPADIDEFDRIFADRRASVVSNLVVTGVDVVVTRLGITSDYLELLSDHDIVGIRGVNRLKLTQVAQATGARVVMDPMDVEPADLGTAGIVEQISIGQRRNGRKQRRIVVFDDCSEPASVTVVLSGVFGQLSGQMSAEIRKAAKAVAVARGTNSHQPGVLPGGGATEIQIAQAVEKAAKRHDSRVQLSMSAFADAVEMLVFALAKNAGRDPLATVADLRSAQNDGNGTSGLVLPGGGIEDAFEAGVLDPVAIRRPCYVSAVEVADVILRIDDTIDAKVIEEPTDPDDVIYDERGEKHHDYLEENEGTRWS